MPPLFAFFLASATATVNVAATVPPHCGFISAATYGGAWCNAEHWTVVARATNGAETVLWRGNGVASVTLPAKRDVTYRLDVDY